MSELTESCCFPHCDCTGRDAVKCAKYYDIYPSEKPATRESDSIPGERIPGVTTLRKPTDAACIDMGKCLVPENCCRYPDYVANFAKLIPNPDNLAQLTKPRFRISWAFNPFGPPLGYWVTPYLSNGQLDKLDMRNYKQTHLPELC